MTREKYIDILKGISILCIVLIHYEDNVLCKNALIFIGAFMVRAFYITSGWLSAIHPTQRTFKELIKKRWKQLGIPYIWWTGIILTFDLILVIFGYYDYKFIGSEIYKAIILRGIGTLWFLPALFGGEILWHYIRRKRIYLQSIAAIITACYIYYYLQFFDNKNDMIWQIIRAPFQTIYNILSAWIGIAFGYYGYKISQKYIKTKSRAIISGVSICCFAFITLNYIPNKPYPISNIIALILPIGLLLILKHIYLGKISSFFEYWGQNSLNVMVTHYSITMVLFKILCENFLTLEYTGYLTLICFCISLPVQILLIKIVNKYIPFSLGK